MYFEPVTSTNTNTFKIKFKYADNWLCLLKWQGSNRISDFDCKFPQEKRI